MGIGHELVTENETGKSPNRKNTVLGRTHCRMMRLRTEEKDVTIGLNLFVFPADGINIMQWPNKKSTLSVPRLEETDKDDGGIVRHQRTFAASVCVWPILSFTTHQPTDQSIALLIRNGPKSWFWIMFPFTPTTVLSSRWMRVNCGGWGWCCLMAFKFWCVVICL